MASITRQYRMSMGHTPSKASYFGQKRIKLATVARRTDFQTIINVACRNRGQQIRTIVSNGIDTRAHWICCESAFIRTYERLGFIRRRRQPSFVVSSVEDNRHSMMDLRDGRRRMSGHDSAGLEYENFRRCCQRVLPAFPDAGKGEQTFVCQRYSIGLLRCARLFRLPFVKPVSGDKTTTLAKGIAKRRLARYGFTARIDEWTGSSCFFGP